MIIETNRKGPIYMKTFSKDSALWDKNGFPRILPPEKLEQMKERLGISRETFQNIHTYFDAADHLYARISLETLYGIYNSQNPPVSQEDFLDAAEIISHEQKQYAILRPEVFHADAAPSQPMDQELVADHLYSVGDEYYYEMERAQEGKPWYIPERAHFLLYADQFYLDKTPQLLAMADYLRATQRKLRCQPMKIAEELAMMLRMDGSLRQIVRDGQRMGVRFQTQQDFRTFLQLCLELSQHTRRYSLRGHTPEELGLPQKRMEEAIEEAAYDPEYRDPIVQLGAALRTKFKESATASRKPARNAPCPCGSGRKYKNCCGKGK